jgi:type II secretory pathway component GspD/PulD (secretin)
MVQKSQFPKMPANYSIKPKATVVALVLAGCISAGFINNASSAVTTKPLSYSTMSRPLSEVIAELQPAIGAQILLRGGLSPNMMVRGEFSGSTGYIVIGQLAKKIGADWATTDNEVYLVPAGQSATETFQVGNKEVAKVSALRAADILKGRGSNISVQEVGDNIAISGPAPWVKSFNTNVMPMIVNDARKELMKQISGTTVATSGPSDVMIPPTTAGGYSLMVFKLKNAWVDDKQANVGGTSVLVPGVATMFRQLTGIGSPQNPGKSPTFNPNDPAGTAQKVQSLPAVAGNLRPLAGLLENSNSGKDSNEKKNDAAGPPGENVRTVLSDPRNNSVIIRDHESMYDKYKELITFLDQPSNMIQIDSFIVDLSTTQASQFGFGISWGANGNTANSGTVNPGGSAPTNPNVIFQGNAGAQLLSNIRALESRGESQIVSVPTVVALNNLEAIYSNRQTFYIKVDGYQDASLTAVTAQTFLKVTPMMSSDPTGTTGRRIKMLINVQDSNVVPAASVNGTPIINENQIATQAIINDGDTLVIGGQVIRKSTNNDSGLPFLSRLPILGALFSTRERNYEEYVRIYILRPRFLGEDSIQATNYNSGNPSKDILMDNVLIKKQLPRIIQGTAIDPVSAVNLDPGQRETSPKGIFNTVPGPDAYIPKPLPVAPGSSTAPTEAPTITPVPQ